MMTEEELRSNHDVTLERIAEIIALNIKWEEDGLNLWVEYERPLNFYVRRSAGSILKFSASMWLESCNSLSLGDEPYFKDVDDIIHDLDEHLGGDSFELIVGKLKEHPDLLTITRKF